MHVSWYCERRLKALNILEDSLSCLDPSPADQIHGSYTKIDDRYIASCNWNTTNTAL